MWFEAQTKTWTYMDSSLFPKYWNHKQVIYSKFDFKLWTKWKNRIHPPTLTDTNMVRKNTYIKYDHGKYWRMKWTKNITFAVTLNVTIIGQLTQSQKFCIVVEMDNNFYL